MCSSDDDATIPSDGASSSAAATADAGESPSAEVTEAELDDACSSSEPDSPLATGEGDGDGRAAEPNGNGSGTSTGLSSSSTEGCARESATAATAKADPSIVVERFAVAAAQTLAEHVAEHNYPVHVRQFGACPFWKHRKACGDLPGTSSPVASISAETALANEDCLEGAAACPWRAYAHMETSHPWPDFRGCDSKARRLRKHHRLRLLQRSGGMDTRRCELAASAAFPRTIPQLGENSWQRKQQKREAAVTACKRSQEYHTWERMHVPLHDVREEPDPTDPRIPKRTWEKQVRLWRNDIRLAAGVLFSI